jgi:hypothetical protein
LRVEELFSNPDDLFSAPPVIDMTVQPTFCLAWIEAKNRWTHFDLRGSHL